jgi:geranylgeranyl diphosphate synthase type II
LDSLIHHQQLIEAALKDKSYGASPKELYEPIDYIMSLGGKRMRPLFVLMGCDLMGGNVSKALHTALAVEIFHNFTLMHDDIMDKAPLRRGKSTVHEKWNDNIAILSGDAMMVKAYQELCKSDATLLPTLLSVFSDTAIKVCEGQQLDMNYERLSKVSISQYIKMIELKTAVLVAASFKMGALIAGANETDAHKLYEFGKHIGIAFQLQDDILDVYADTEKFGKQKGGDIVSNKKTFLLLKAIEMADSNRHLKEELHQWIHAPSFEIKDKVQAVTAIYDFLNIKELAKKEMKKQYDAAFNSLNEIALDSSKKQTLTDIANSLMGRES